MDVDAFHNHHSLRGVQTSVQLIQCRKCAVANVGAIRSRYLSQLFFVLVLFQLYQRWILCTGLPSVIFYDYRTVFDMERFLVMFEDCPNDVGSCYGYCGYQLNSHSVRRSWPVFCAINSLARTHFSESQKYWFIDTGHSSHNSNMARNC